MAEPLLWSFDDKPLAANDDAKENLLRVLAIVNASLCTPVTFGALDENAKKNALKAEGPGRFRLSTMWADHCKYACKPGCKLSAIRPTRETIIGFDMMLVQLMRDYNLPAELLGRTKDTMMVVIEELNFLTQVQEHFEGRKLFLSIALRLGTPNPFHSESEVAKSCANPELPTVNDGARLYLFDHQDPTFGAVHKQRYSLTEKICLKFPRFFGDASPLLRHLAAGDVASFTTVSDKLRQSYISLYNKALNNGDIIKKELELEANDLQMLFDLTEIAYYYRCGVERAVWEVQKKVIEVNRSVPIPRTKIPREKLDFRNTVDKILLEVHRSQDEIMRTEAGLFPSIPIPPDHPPYQRRRLQQDREEGTQYSRAHGPPRMVFGGFGDPTVDEREDLNRAVLYEAARQNHTRSWRYHPPTEEDYERIFVDREHVSRNGEEDSDYGDEGDQDRDEVSHGSIPQSDEEYASTDENMPLL
jgi:hypothetical protein